METDITNSVPKHQTNQQRQRGHESKIQEPGVYRLGLKWGQDCSDGLLVSGVLRHVTRRDASPSKCCLGCLPRPWGIQGDSMLWSIQRSIEESSAASRDQTFPSKTWIRRNDATGNWQLLIGDTKEMRRLRFQALWITLPWTTSRLVLVKAMRRSMVAWRSTRSRVIVFGMVVGNTRFAFEAVCVTDKGVGLSVRSTVRVDNNFLTP